MTQGAEPTKKVLFRVVGNEGDVNVETLWAFDLSDDRFKIDNSPFYAYSVSAGDTVLAPTDPTNGRPTFRSVVEKSGNRTVRLVVDLPLESGNASDQLLRGLVEMGCEFEGASRRYFSINIPPRVELATVRDYLVENAATWEHADPSYSELYPDEI